MKLIYSVAAVLALATVSNAAAVSFANNEAPVLAKGAKNNNQADRKAENQKKRAEAQAKRAAANAAKREREAKRKELERKKANAEAAAAKRAAAKKAAEEAAAARKRENEKKEAEKKRAAEKAAAERKRAAEKAAAEKKREREAAKNKKEAAAEKKAAEKAAAKKAAEEKAAAEKAAKEKAASEKAAAEKAAAEKAAAEKAAAEKAAAEKAAAEKAAAEKAAAEKAAAEKAAAEKAAAEKAAKEASAKLIAEARGKSVEYDGYLYSTLDQADKNHNFGQSAASCNAKPGDPNHFFEVPVGWEVVDQFDAGIKSQVIAPYAWGTRTITSKTEIVNVKGFKTPGALFQGGSWFQEKDGKYRTNNCDCKILIRIPLSAEHAAASEKAAKEAAAKLNAEIRGKSVEYEGYLYSTLDQADPNHAIGQSQTSCNAKPGDANHFFEVPAGWEVVDQFNAGIKSQVIAQYAWGTRTITSKTEIVNVKGFKTPGALFQGGSWFSEKDGKYRTSQCDCKILIRTRV